MEEEDLRPVFEEFGEIFDLAVIRDKISGLHRGENACPTSDIPGGTPSVTCQGEPRAAVLSFRSFVSCRR